VTAVLSTAAFAQTVVEQDQQRDAASGATAATDAFATTVATPAKKLQMAGHICEAFPAMPFTFAHPAAVLPLRRSRLLHTIPLIIGSLMPDVPYYFPTRVSRMLIDTHTLYGSFAICLPWGMAALILIMMLRQPLTVLLSARVRWACLRSLDRFTERPFHWPVAFLSILIGSWTHIAWDSFTHQSGWTTTRVAVLSAPISIFGWETETSHLLQYVSSVLGLVFIAIWFAGVLKHVPADAVADTARPRARWTALIAITVVALLIGVSRAFLDWHSGSYYFLGYLLLTCTIGWFSLLYLLAGMLAAYTRVEQPETVS
jgi:hypothetical protein